MLRKNGDKVCFVLSKKPRVFHHFLAKDCFSLVWHNTFSQFCKQLLQEILYHTILGINCTEAFRNLHKSVIVTALTMVCIMNAR